MSAVGASRRALGFTLIELMITVAVVAILAAVAYPNYADYVLRGKLIEGTTKLSQYRVDMEQYFMDNRRYVTVAGGNICGAPLPPTSPKDAFVISCDNASNTAYIAHATGKSTDAARAFEYRVNQNNVKSSFALPSTWNSTYAAVCWVARKDGSC